MKGDSIDNHGPLIESPCTFALLDDMAVAVNKSHMHVQTVYSYRLQELIASRTKPTLTKDLRKSHD